MQAARPPARHRFMTMTVKGLANPVLLGVIGAAHGIKGELRIKSYTGDPTAIASYGPLATADGRRFEILAVRLAQEVVVARLKGVEDRNAAEALTGTELFVDRAVLPEPDDEDEFLHADLVGLAAETEDGAVLGHVVAIHDFGGGDMIEIRPPAGESLLLPFTKAVVPVIDLPGRRLVVRPPDTIDAPG